MRSIVARVALAIGVGLASLVVAAEPAAACSCGGDAVPTVDFTGVAVEDLGYAGDGGETRSWVLEVIDARLGVDDGERVEMTMSVGRILYANGDEALMGCGMDDNLIVGESYDVASTGLEPYPLNTCGSQVDGPRDEVPVRGQEEDDGRLRDLLVIFGGGLVLLLLTGLMVVRPWRDRETFHKRE